jgi:DNA/RNA-binding domain of Phe-tRNA-synthetase-like protein
MFIVSDEWKAAYPGAAAGILVMHDVANPASHPALDRLRAELENELRSRFAGGDRGALVTLPAIQAYNSYFKRYGKTYHVQLQLESVVFKGKSIPRVAALVEAMFIAELRNLLLTAGHDVLSIRPPIRLGVAKGDEHYVLLNGREQALKAGDMMMADGQGVISSVLFGPDQRTRITAGTRQVIFAVYAPPGIGEPAVRHHLQDIQANVLLIAPNARAETLAVHAT